MELENLKQQWNVLSEQVKKQKILNKKLIDNAVDAKMDTIMKYNLVGIGCCVLYVLLVIFYPPTIFSRHVTIYLNIIIFQVINMLTSVQKEILQTLINLYQSSDGNGAFRVQSGVEISGTGAYCQFWCFYCKILCCFIFSNNLNAFC